MQISSWWRADYIIMCGLDLFKTMNEHEEVIQRRKLMRKTKITRHMKTKIIKTLLNMV